MTTIADELQSIQDFNALLPFLRNRMGWPIDESILEEDDPLEEVTFTFTSGELGIDPDYAAQIREIRQVRPFRTDQPFGIFLVSFEDKSLKVTAMRRILRALATKSRASNDATIHARWDINDLMFISNYGESGKRKLSFAHFYQNGNPRDLPILRVIGWDDDDAPTRMQIQADVLTQQLKFPSAPTDIEEWRKRWVSAFTWRPGQVIATTKDLVSRLADLSTKTRRNIQDIMEIESAEGPLHSVMGAFRQSVFPFLDVENFADMYAQTVAYGLLQAKVSRTSHDEIGIDDAATMVPEDIIELVGHTNPFLRPLFKTFLAIGEHHTGVDFDEIGLNAVRDLLNNTNMSEVLADFDRKNPKQNPRIHLYEGFLKEYDNDRHTKHGVFYTPQEVVQFIIRSVHETLQNEFGLVDGLADTTTWAELAARSDDIIIPDGWDEQPFVQILDPATGTGTFLIEAINHIHNHMMEKWRSEGRDDTAIKTKWQSYVEDALLPRLHGFELMMAPYAMAHLGIAMKLADTGYEAPKNSSRVSVYLTNTLADPFETKEQLEMGFLEDALAEEGKGANHIKRDVPITVVIGNPPYSGHSMNASKNSHGKPTWIGKLIEPYFYIDGLPLGERNSKWLNDDYVKFIRYAEYRLERASVGVLGYITNHSFIDNPTFRGMRQHLITGASNLHILDLHGNSKKNETAPDGSKDENVFDIQQGVAIMLLSKNLTTSQNIYKSDIYGHRSGDKGKLSSLNSRTLSEYDKVHLAPTSPGYFLFQRDDTLEGEFESYYNLTNILPVNSVGIVTARDHLCIQDSPANVENTVSRFSKLSPEEARVEFKLGSDVRDWKVDLAQKDIKDGYKLRGKIVPLQYRPFDTRYTYYTGKSKGFICMPRPEVMKHLLDGDNLGLVSVRQVAEGIFNHCIVSDKIIESRMTLSNKGIGYFFPLKLVPAGVAEIHHRPNLSSKFREALTEATDLAFQPLVECQPIGDPPDQQLGLGIIPESPQQQVLHENILQERGNLATTYGCRDAFDYIYAILHSPTYRERYAEFLKFDFPRIPLPGGIEIFKALIPLGAELIQFHLLDESHPALKRPSVVFRGHGDNRLGKTGQIKWENGKMQINAAQWFEEVPEASVEFAIAGYKPLQKWLKDRAEKGGKNPTPGHMLTEADTLHYRRMVVAITETRRLMTAIDAVIEQHGKWPSAFGV